MAQLTDDQNRERVPAGKAGGPPGGRPTHTFSATVVVPLRPLRRLRLWLRMRLISLFRSPRLEMLSILHFGDWSLRGSRALRQDRLLRTSLFFLADFDGDTADYIMSLARASPTSFRRLFGSCAGYPSARKAGELLAFIDRFNHQPQCFYSAYPDASLNDVRYALELTPRLDALLAADTRAQPALWAGLMTDLVQQGAFRVSRRGAGRWRARASKLVDRSTRASFSCIHPLPPGSDLPAVTARLREVEQDLAAALDNVGNTHFARLTIVDRLYDDRNRLQPFAPAQLLFSVQFDRIAGHDHLLELCEELCRARAGGTGLAADIWGACDDVAPDTAGDAAQLRELLDARRLSCGLLVTGTPVSRRRPPASVERIRSCLRDAEAIRRLVDEGIRSPEQLRKRLDETFDGRPTGRRNRHGGRG
jgi:hypothetical protein